MLGSILFLAFFGLNLAAKIPPRTHLTHFLLDGKIVGGENTTIEKYPYQVSLLQHGRHICGGSLIRPDVVLTAAHCTAWREASTLRVRAGSTIKNSGGELADVLNICQHKDYYPYDYDVAVLQLSRAFPIGTGIQTITLQPADMKVEDGSVATVTGWGRPSYGGSSPTILQVVQVPKIAAATCQDNYYLQKDITNRMHCFGYTENGKDSCQGDYGGPLVVDGVQAGIVSWGDGCAVPNLPGVYTKIADKSITNHINECIAKFEHLFAI